VTRFGPGARVAAIFMQSWLAARSPKTKSKSALGGGMDGMLAEYVVLDEEGLVPIPEHSLTRRPLPALRRVTAWNALVAEGGIRAATRCWCWAPAACRYLRCSSHVCTGLA